MSDVRNSKSLVRSRSLVDCSAKCFKASEEVKMERTKKTAKNSSGEKAPMKALPTQAARTTLKAKPKKPYRFRPGTCHRAPAACLASSSSSLLVLPQARSRFARSGSNRSRRTSGILSCCSSILFTRVQQTLKAICATEALVGRRENYFVASDEVLNFSLWP